MENSLGKMYKLLPSASFVCLQMNASTFLVVEDDSFGEHPFIYVKIYPDHLMITDTGCNSPRPHDRTITSLRKYLETVPVPANKDQPLNPLGKKSYIIICSHCHYDHVLGIPQFNETNPVIVASSYDKSFLLEDFPSHSLCRYIDQPCPKYHISHWAQHLEYFSLPNSSSSSTTQTTSPFRIQFLHIPGHTPDSLAWYDLDEHHLYVGDTFYTRRRERLIPGIPDDAGQEPDLPADQAAIIFNDEGGNWIEYMSSLDLLLSFVQYRNAELLRQQQQQYPVPSPPPPKTRTMAQRVKVGAGHLTLDADAQVMIEEVTLLFKKIIRGEVPVKRSAVQRGVVYDYWLESDDARYSVMAPRRLALEAREHFHVPRV